MSPRVLDAAGALIAALHELDVRLQTPAQCVVLVEQLARVERVCAAVRTEAAARAIEYGAHRTSGVANGAEWLARETGMGSGEAARSLKTVQELGDRTETRAAVKAGEVSLQQAHEIVQTAAACPESEREMLERARHDSLQGLRDAGRRKRLHAIDPNELHRRQREARYHRQWRDQMGMVRYSGALPPDVGVPIMNRLDVETDRQWRAAHRAKQQIEPRERYAADAFVEVMRGGGKRHAVRADVVYVCNVETGESHIVGGGPVPESRVREAARDGFIKAVLHDGRKVDTIVHYGRCNIPAELRTVIELGDPPAFDGVTCLDCGRTFRLEWDHGDPVANNGPTSRDNFRRRCHDCHVVKTEQDRLAGLLSGRAP